MDLLLVRMTKTGGGMEIKKHPGGKLKVTGRMASGFQSTLLIMYKRN